LPPVATPLPLPTVKIIDGAFIGCFREQGEYCRPEKSQQHDLFKRHVGLLGAFEPIIGW